MDNQGESTSETNLKPLGQDSHSANQTGYSDKGVSSIIEEEGLCQLESQLADTLESDEFQWTSTPTDQSPLTPYSKEVAFAKENTQDQDSKFSPVLHVGSDAEINAPHAAFSISSEPSALTGDYSREPSLETSQSLYVSAQSNINVITESSDGCSFSGNSETFHVSMSESSSAPLQELTICEESESAVQNSAWATAWGFEEEISDAKDAATVLLEPECKGISQDVRDNLASYTADGSEDNGIPASAELFPPQKPSDDSVGIDDGGQRQLLENYIDVNVSQMDSPDLDLLNEICEEATSMTIKEALIFSLKPGVRAGLREGRLLLSESEVMALEQYCEHFIDNLFSELVDAQWTRVANLEVKNRHPPEDKAIIARKLRDFDLDTLRANCDRFVHSIITESIHNSCFKLQLNEVKLVESGEKSELLDHNSVRDVFPLFQESETVQQYIGHLTADIIKSALVNLSSSIATKNAEKNVYPLLNKNDTSHQQTNKDIVCDALENIAEIPDDTANNVERTKWEHSGGVFSVNEMSTVDSVANNSGEESDQYHKEDTMELSDAEEDFVCSSYTNALETSLEFDAGDWEGGGLFLEPPTPTDTKQKIVLHELSFDEHADVAGTELLAPVFLAIAEENDDDTEFQGLRKKAQSIENLCGIIEEKESENLRERNLSATKRISLTLPVPDILAEVSQADEEEAEQQESDNGKESEHESKSAVTAEIRSQKEMYRWHTVCVNKREKVLDLKLLEPYMKVISHGGYFSNTKATIVVIAACYWPDRNIKNYNFLMEQLFFYVVSTLELLAIHEDYYLVYLNGGTRQQNMPTVSWMKRFYQYIEGGLKKRMKAMFIVHPNFWLKTVIRLSKPFMNSSFWRKLAFVQSLQTLTQFVPVDYIYIPDEVMRVDPLYRMAHSR